MFVVLKFERFAFGFDLVFWIQLHLLQILFWWWLVAYVVSFAVCFRYLGFWFVVLMWVGLISVFVNVVYLRFYFVLDTLFD